jgi:hypothetical protein
MTGKNGWAASASDVLGRIWPATILTQGSQCRPDLHDLPPMV